VVQFQNKQAHIKAENIMARQYLKEVHIFEEEDQGLELTVFKDIMDHLFIKAQVLEKVIAIEKIDIDKVYKFTKLEGQLRDLNQVPTEVIADIGFRINMQRKNVTRADIVTLL